MIEEKCLNMSQFAVRVLKQYQTHFFHFWKNGWHKCRFILHSSDRVGSVIFGKTGLDGQLNPVEAGSKQLFLNC